MSQCEEIVTSITTCLEKQSKDTTRAIYVDCGCQHLLPATACQLTWVLQPWSQQNSTSEVDTIMDREGLMATVDMVCNEIRYVQTSKAGFEQNMTVESDTIAFALVSIGIGSTSTWVSSEHCSQKSEGQVSTPRQAYNE